MDIRSKKESSADYRQIEEPARFPSSYIFQLTKTGIRNPVCTLIRSKAGVCVYRVKSEGKRLILKPEELKSGGILRHLREWTGLGAAGA